VVKALLGEPSQVSRHEQRWGRHGSVALHRSGAKRGLWFDHERGEGGNLLHLIARERRVPLGDAIAIAKHEFLGGLALPPVPLKPRRSRAPAGDASARIGAALRIWSTSVPINGTLAEHYFVARRGLDIRSLELAHVLRWHVGMHAVVGLMRDAISGEPSGVHRTFLDNHGVRIERKMLGRQGVVRLSPDDDVTVSLGISEGIEDGLAVLLCGWAPVWAATSAGAIARFPVLSGIEALTVFADADAPGMRATETCAANWRVAGREVRVALGKGMARA
jgi:hypothetical protein